MQKYGTMKQIVITEKEINTIEQLAAQRIRLNAKKAVAAIDRDIKIINL